MSQTIRPIGSDAVHVCIDMQRIFAERTAWHTASIPVILPLTDLFDPADQLLQVMLVGCLGPAEDHL